MKKRTKKLLRVLSRIFARTGSLGSQPQVHEEIKRTEPGASGRPSKVLFSVLDPDGEIDIETLWAEDLGGDHFRVENLPYYAYGVSLHDIIYAPPSIKYKMPTFDKVMQKSGNRTLRIILDPPVAPGNKSEGLLQDIASMGCEWEGANRAYIAVCVPASVDLDLVTQYLVRSDAQWEHADPKYGELYPDDAECK